MRRALLPCLAIVAQLAACSPPAPIAAPAPPAPAAPPMLFGGDISALARLERAGAVFRDGDAAVGAIAAMRAHGSNSFRLRLFLAPNGEEVQVNDLPYTIALARRVKASGASLMLDLHYSDTWADPQHQVTPAAWSALGIDALEDTVEAYTARVLDTMRMNGVLPGIVEVGNEIDGGFLWPLGRLGPPLSTDTAAQARFGRLLRAGIRGVRRATTPRDSVQVMVHFSQGASVEKTRWFYDIVAAQGIEYDLLGLSFYPWWHGSIGQLRENLVATAQRYGKPIVVVETAYPWREGWRPDGPIGGTTIWPMTPEGQRAFLRDVVAAVRAIPGGLGRGVYWWYPEAIQVPGMFVWGGGALAMFDESGRILPSAGVFGGAGGTRPPR